MTRATLFLALVGRTALARNRAPMRPASDPEKQVRAAEAIADEQPDFSP